MAAVSIRQTIARPTNRTGLLAAAIVWVITRVPMYLIAAGQVHVPSQSRFTGDILIYERWLPALVHGRFPVADPQWQYPPGAGLVLSLPHLFASHYAHAFYALELLCDLVVTIVLIRMAIKRGSWLGCWCWLVGIPLLGPVVLGHFDIAATLFAVVALYLADSPSGLGIFAGLGTIVKVWPLVVLLGVRPAHARRAISYFVATLGVVVAAYLVFTNGSLSFLSHQDSRGLEIESLAAQPFLLLRKMGLWHGHVVYQYGSLQLVGAGVGLATTLTVASMVIAIVLLAYWRWRMSWQPEVLCDAALVATLLLVITSRVISVQYMIWLLGVAACALAFPRTSQRLVALLVVVAAGLTLLEWMFLLKDISGAGASGAAGIGLLVLRDAVLLAAAVLGYIRLWRSSCNPQSQPATGGVSTSAVKQTAGRHGRAKAAS